MNENTTEIESEIRKLLADKINVTEYSLGMSHSVVETKNIKLNENSKVNHLSYIGDAQVGKNVNIGAGTITCN